MGFKKGDDIMKVGKGMRDQYPRFMNARRQWDIDQGVVTQRIKEWHGFPSRYISMDVIIPRIGLISALTLA